jgi:hypothetical protein
VSAARHPKYFKPRAQPAHLMTLCQATVSPLWHLHASSCAYHHVKNVHEYLFRLPRKRFLLSGGKLERGRCTSKDRGCFLWDQSERRWVFKFWNLGAQLPLLAPVRIAEIPIRCRFRLKRTGACYCGSRKSHAHTLNHFKLQRQCSC